MIQSRAETRQPVEHPEHAVRREFLEPILLLAERMVATDPLQPRPERSVVDRLAGLCGLRGFREQQSYRRLSEATACAQLTTERSRKGALVVLALALKSDTNGGEAARAYFSQVREWLGLEPIAVPANTEEHWGLALSYLRD